MLYPQILPFNAEEVKHKIKGLKPNKVPGKFHQTNKNKTYCLLLLIKQFWILFSDLWVQVYQEVPSSDSLKTI